MKKRSTRSGMSLVEVLIVIVIFAILGILISRAILLSIGGSKKSESLIKVRENLDYSFSVMERQFVNANSVPDCPNSDPKILDYLDSNGLPASFSCQTDSNGNGFIASGSAILTDSSVDVVNCSITCVLGLGANPPIISVSLQAQDASASGAQKGIVTLDSKVSLRNY